MTERFTFRDLDSWNSLKSKAETKESLNTGWSEAVVTGRMSFMQDVFIGELVLDVNTRATIVPWDNLWDWFGGPFSGNGDGFFIEKATLAKKLVGLPLPYLWGHQCFS